MTPRRPCDMTERQLIELAVKLVDADRKIAVDSFSDTNGRITNIDDRKIVRDYDRFLKPARAWLKRHS